MAAPTPFELAATTVSPARALRRRPASLVVAAVYLLSATWLSLWLAAQMPAEGPRITELIPADSLIVLRIKDGDAAWRALEAHPGVQALWEDQEFQRRTGARAKYERALEKWRRLPAVARCFVALDRPGLNFLFGGEAALALLPPAQGEATPDQPAGLVLVRLQGARGMLFRLGAAWTTRVSGTRNFHDLGGGLIAFGRLEGPPQNRPETGGRRPEEMPPLNDSGGRRACDPVNISAGRMQFLKLPASGLQPDVVAELRVRPRAMAAARRVSWLEALDATPGPSEILALARPPDEISLRVRPCGAHGLLADGEWRGALPPADAAAPLWRPLPPAGPMLDFVGPLDPGAASWRVIQAAIAGSAKERRRWEARLVHLTEANVDLDRDLWPDLGHVLRVQIVPPPTGAALEQALILFSLPLQARPASRRALAVLAESAGSGLFDSAAPRDAKRPYFIRFKERDCERYVWIKGNFTRPMWVVTDGALGFVSDAGPPALLPGFQGVGCDAAPAPTRPLLALTVHGAPLAPHLGALAQMQLEDLRDEMGAAEFLAAYPDERAVVKLVEKLSAFVGDLTIEVREAPAATPARATVHLQWSPRLRPEPPPANGTLHSLGQ